MNMRELLQWKEDQKKAKAAKWNAEGAGTISGFTQTEFDKSMKDIKQKSSTTRRTHSRGNLWNHTNLPSVKSEKIDLVIGGKLVKY